jgi:hypothetical protein
VTVDVSDPGQPRLLAARPLVERWPWATSLGRVEAAAGAAFVLYDWASGDWWQSVAWVRPGGAEVTLALPAARASDLATDGAALYLANGDAGLVELVTLAEAPPTPTPPGPDTPTPTATGPDTPTPATASPTPPTGEPPWVDGRLFLPLARGGADR